MRRHYMLSINRVLFFVFAAGLLVCIVACNTNKGDKKDNSKESATISSGKVKKFTMVDIPIALTTPEARADFLVRHYWDNFDFSDTAYINKPDITEQAFADYINIFSHTEREAVSYSIDKVLDSASQNTEMFNYILGLYKKYLYDPNSPLRNEEYYIPVLNYIVNSDNVNAAEKTRSQYILDMVMKNRVGEKATNITYTLASGKTGTLYNIRGNYTILMFHNPDCHTCGETIAHMKASPVINGLLNEKQLSVLAFYPDEDLEIWKKHLSDLPSEWVNGYDKNQFVEKNKLYDLKAIPTLYLLDKDKKILLKDATIQVIERYLWESAN